MGWGVGVGCEGGRAGAGWVVVGGGRGQRPVGAPLVNPLKGRSKPRRSTPLTVVPAGGARAECLAVIAPPILKAGRGGGQCESVV